MATFDTNSEYDRATLRKIQYLNDSNLDNNKDLSDAYIICKKTIYLEVVRLAEIKSDLANRARKEEEAAWVTTDCSDSDKSEANDASDKSGPVRSKTGTLDKPDLKKSEAKPSDKPEFYAKKHKIKGENNITLIFKKYLSLK